MASDGSADAIAATARLYGRATCTAGIPDRAGTAAVNLARTIGTSKTVELQPAYNWKDSAHHRSETSVLLQLREGDQGSDRWQDFSLLQRHGTETVAGTHPRSTRQQQGLRTRKLQMGDSQGADGKPHLHIGEDVACQHWQEAKSRAYRETQTCQYRESCFEEGTQEYVRSRKATM